MGFSRMSADSHWNPFCRAFNWLWIMICTIYQQDRVPIRIQPQNYACGAFSFISFACSTFFSRKNLACSACFFIICFVCGASYFSVFFIFNANSLLLKMICQFKYSVITSTQHVEKKQWRRCQITNSSFDQTSWDTNHATSIQLQNSL